MAEPTIVTASLNYLVRPEGDTELFYTKVVDSTELKTNVTTKGEDVPIENIRGNEGSVTLDATGFQYFKRAAKHTSFTDDVAIKEEYYPESIDLLKELTGASKVVIFDHTLRNNTPGDLVNEPGTRKAGAQVHIDQTKKASIARVHRHVPEEAESLLKKRFQIINLWRPIKHAAYDHPLALCDYHSVDTEKDVVHVTLNYPDFKGEIMFVEYNPNHRWKYLRGMTPEELVLIKCFDSNEDGKTAIYTPHTAFIDPTTPEGSPGRRSIEIRALVFYD
ncbi:hypothetical protein BDQ17DRAFT_1429903 [Cyathus striatus]|nr:hypothetical protein BDQ17DRAFT_1429903 [Cyathus striatus]